MTLNGSTVTSRLLSLDAALSDGLTRMFYGLPSTPERYAFPAPETDLRDLSGDNIRQKYYDRLTDHGLLDQGKGQRIRAACEPSVSACASAWHGLCVMMSASSLNSVGARWQSQIQLGNTWVGPSVDCVVGRKGQTLLLNFEAFNNLWSVEARVGVSQNELNAGFESGLSVGGTRAFAYAYRSYDWYLTRSGIHREIDDSLYLRVGVPTAGVVLMVDRAMKHFTFKFDIKSRMFLERWGFQPKASFKVIDEKKFSEGLNEFMAAHRRQYAALGRLRELILRQ